MAQIFQEAADEIRSSTPSCRTLANTRRSRCPLPFGSRFGEINSDGHDEDGGSPCSHSSACTSSPPDIPLEAAFHTSLPFYQSRHHPDSINIVGKEPLSSGFTTPAKPSSRGFGGGLILSSSLTPDPQDNDCHSSHGVPLVLPVRGTEKEMMDTRQVHAWLDEILEPSPPHTNHPAFKESINHVISTPSLRVTGLSPWSRTPGKVNRSQDNSCSKPSLSRLVSNKENTPPSAVAKTWSKVASPLAEDTRNYLSMTQVHPRASDQSSSNSSESPLGPARADSTSCSLISRAPHGLLHLAPNRKKAKITKAIEQNNKEPDSSNFIICEDESSDILADLSPVVERHRRGKGPKRDRCSSYYDHDILPQFSPLNDRNGRKGGEEKVETRKGRRVFGDAKNSAEWIKAKAFDEVAENAEFDFIISIE